MINAQRREPELHCCYTVLLAHMFCFAHTSSLGSKAIIVDMPYGRTSWEIRNLPEWYCEIQCRGLKSFPCYHIQAFSLLGYQQQHICNPHHL